MNVVDSSAWLEYFADGPNAKHFEAPLRDSEKLLVSVVSLYEVFKVTLRERGENEALQVMAAMRKGRLIELTEGLALLASQLSLAHNLPMADSMILATARSHKATLWTQDSDFQAIPGVRYFAKR